MAFRVLGLGPFFKGLGFRVVLGFGFFFKGLGFRVYGVEDVWLMVSAFWTSSGLGAFGCLALVTCCQGQRDRGGDR